MKNPFEPSLTLVYYNTSNTEILMWKIIDLQCPAYLGTLNQSQVNKVQICLFWIKFNFALYWIIIVWKEMFNNRIYNVK